MEKRRLPVGIQTFRRIREEGYYYVDKTAYALRIARSAGAHYFLSRPRRFGKSLFVDTLKELYEGSEPLFRGLAVHGVWDWSKRHPVVRLDFAGGNFKRPGALAESATAQIEDSGRRAGIDPSSGSAPVRFHRLIEALHEQTGERVVVLVDESDKPILDACDEAGTSATEGRRTTLADNAQAKANRDDLRGLYGTLKACDAHVELTFVTGVSKFAKVSLWHRRNEIARYEGYWSSVFYAFFQASMDGVTVEDANGRGRLDMAVAFGGNAFLFEFKVAERVPGQILSETCSSRNRLLEKTGSS